MQHFHEEGLGGAALGEEGEVELLLGGVCDVVHLWEEGEEPAAAVLWSKLYYKIIVYYIICKF